MSAQNHSWAGVVSISCLRLQTARTPLLSCLPMRSPTTGRNFPLSSLVRQRALPSAEHWPFIPLGPCPGFRSARTREPGVVSCTPAELRSASIAAVNPAQARLLGEDPFFPFFDKTAQERLGVKKQTAQKCSGTSRIFERKKSER